MRVAIGFIAGILLAVLVLVVLIWLRDPCCCGHPAHRPAPTFRPQSEPSRPIPEPGSLALLAAGAAGLWGMRR